MAGGVAVAPLTTGGAAIPSFDMVGTETGCEETGFADIVQTLTENSNAPLRTFCKIVPRIQPMEDTSRTLRTFVKQDVFIDSYNIGYIRLPFVVKRGNSCGKSDYEYNGPAWLP